MAVIKYGDDENVIIANRELAGVDWAAPYMGQ